MAGFVSRWVVQQEQLVSVGDLAADGSVREDVLRGWITAACDSYLAHCEALGRWCESAGLEIVRDDRVAVRDSLAGWPTSVAVSASATEVHPESFTIAVRIRPAGGHSDVPLDLLAVIRLRNPASGEAQAIGDDIRDELIALEHSARQFN